MRGLQEKKIKGPAMKAGKWKAGKIIFPPFSATGSLLDVEKSNKVNVVYVDLKGAFLIVHVLDLTAAPSSHKGEQGSRDDGIILRRKQG